MLSATSRVTPAPLVCPALVHFFSEKFFGHRMVRVDCVDFHIQPELGALQFYDVNVSPMDWAHTARGRLAILLDLIWDQHGLLCGGCETYLPGKFGDQIANAIMSASVQPFGATRGMSPIGVKNMLALFAPQAKCCKVVVHSALRDVRQSTQATYQLLMCSCLSLRLPGRVRQAVGCVTQVGLADSRCTLCMSLPSCSEQRAGDRTPELGARGPLGKENGIPVGQAPVTCG